MKTSILWIIRYGVDETHLTEYFSNNVIKNGLFKRKKEALKIFKDVKIINEIKDQGYNIIQLNKLIFQDGFCKKTDIIKKSA